MGRKKSKSNANKTETVSGSVSGNKVEGEGQINHNITVYSENKELLEEYRKLFKEHHAEIQKREFELKVMKESYDCQISERDTVLKKITIDFNDANQKLADVNEKYEKNRERYYKLTSEVKDLSNKYPFKKIDRDLEEENNKLKEENDILKKNLVRDRDDIQEIKAIVKKDHLAKNKSEGNLDGSSECEKSDPEDTTKGESSQISLCCIT